MKTAIIFPIALLFLLFFASASPDLIAEKPIGLFDRDSVMQHTPEYQHAMDSVRTYHLNKEDEIKLLDPVNGLIDEAADRLAKKNNYSIVLDRKEFRSLFRNASGFKTVSVTPAMIEEVNWKELPAGQ